MKKFLLLTLSALCLGGINAQTLVSPLADESIETPAPFDIKDSGVGMLDLLREIDGYIFMSLNEDARSFNGIFQRTDSLPDSEYLHDVEWTIANDNVLKYTGNNTFSAIGFGEHGNTLVVGTNRTTGQKVKLVVFVCPTVTVYSPEGAIYKHQKFYDYPAKISLGKSNDYVINCVMHGEDDVTHLLNENGDYVSPDPIREDMTLVVSMESREFEESNDVVGKSGINIQVVGNSVKFVDAATKQKADITENIIIHDLQGKEIYNQPLPEEGVINFNSENHGIFFIDIENDEDGHFKIIIP